MPLLIHAEVHGMAGRVADLRELLVAHAERLAGAPGCLGAAAHERLGGEPGELLLEAWWRDEGSLRAHYATAEYAEYAQRIGELLVRPSDVTAHVVDHSYRPRGDSSLDPTRQD